MKISIAMATYNGAQYILEQLQSFLDQTRQPDEVIITDDCSTDKTECIVREFAKNAPFVVEFYRNEVNLGYCGNFNSALMKTTGDLVFLSDQDDVWFPEKIARMSEIAEHQPDMLVVMNDTMLTDGSLHEVGITKLEQIQSGGFSEQAFVMGCCCAVKRPLLDFCLPIPKGIKGHDNWIVEIADALNVKYIEHRTLQYYRRHESNESQFIANRITKITRFDVFMDRFRNLFKNEEKSSIQSTIQYLELQINALEDLFDKIPTSYRNMLKKHIRTKMLLLDCFRMRHKIREMNILNRLFSGISAYVKGDYGLVSGCSSVVKDILKL